MKVIILEQGSKERALIEQVLQAGKHEAFPVENAEQVWQLISKGESRFVIADAELSDVVATELVRRVRSAGIPPVYFLLLTSREESRAEADDVLHKPFKAVELQTRLTIGQRILSMGDSLSQAREQLENTAMYDPLTGVMNQTAFNRLAKSELERARRAASTLAIVVLDIDNFAAINDRHGNEAGNKVLKVVAENIRERSRPYDCVGHWTGPEFIIALLNVTSAEAEKIARRIITGIRFTEISLQGTSVELGVSAGIATASSITESTDVEWLIQEAQGALKQAKQSGGYQVQLVNM